MERSWKLELGSTFPDEVPNPSWPQILEALHSLDGGVSLDLVLLTLANGGTLTAGGGNEKRYLVVYFPNDHPNSPSLSLADPALIGPPVNLTIQTTDEHEAKFAVNFFLVEKVFAYFFNTGNIPEDVYWEKDE